MSEQLVLYRWEWESDGHNDSDFIYTCPQHSNHCSNYSSQGFVSHDIGRWPSYIAIASSSLSCLGSLLIVVAFIAFKDIRSGMVQRIITSLAIADFFSAAGYIGGSINFLIFFNERSPDRCRVFDALCRSQAFVTTWSSMSSFAWTTFLAFYFYLILVYQRRPFQSKLQQIVLHVFSWVAPLLIVIPLTGIGQLGFARYAASNWCFVKDPNTTNSSSMLQLTESILFVMVAGKFWEILTYIIVIIIYTHIAIFLAKIRRGGYEEVQPVLRENVERRLKFIPIIFLLLRIWGTVQFFVSIAMEAIHPEYQECIPNAFQIVFLVLGILQAIGDPGQGWGNAILYIFMSDPIRTRMISKPLRKCCLKIGRQLVKLGPEESEGRDPGQIQDQRLTGDVAEVNGNAQGDNIQRRRIRRTATISTISCETMPSAPGPIDEARPGPSPVNV